MKNIGGASNLPSPVGIGLTDLPNIGGASGPHGLTCSGITEGWYGAQKEFCQFRNLNSSHPAQHQLISGNYGNGGNIIDSGVSVSGGSDNSDETDNINSSDEIPMSELSSVN